MMFEVDKSILFLDVLIDSIILERIINFMMIIE